ncbi:MAG: HNH endonuclease [Deltaproteobacteria bacterium]|nr:HNH endonuclease [Deltaproteobacteria bacterium]
MSSRIEQVLEVLEEVKEKYLENQSHQPISSLRKKAVQQVAIKRGITQKSVADKYIRQLKPHIRKTNDFDKFLLDWLVKGDNKIQQVLLSRTVTPKDTDLINNFFATTSELIVPNEQIEVDKGGKEVIVYPEENPSVGTYREGNSKRISVNVYERNPRAKKDCVAVYGAACSVCGFRFEDHYGEIGKEFIHVHHLELLSSVGINYELDPVKDLRPVCPNCHAMLHKRNPPFTVEELQQLLK